MSEVQSFIDELSTEDKLKKLIYDLYPLTVIEPVFNEQSPYQFYYPFMNRLVTGYVEQLKILEHLVENGIFKKRIAETLGHCPLCASSFISFRLACPSCLNSDYNKASMVHHFRCGYVGYEKDFINARELSCPKCRKLLRHIGVDYERPAEIFNCNSCDEKFSHPAEGFKCMKCSKSFDKSRIKYRSIFSYEVVLDEAAVFLHQRDHLADKDSRTQLRLYDRAIFLSTLSREVSRAERYENRLVLLRFDWEDYDRIALETSGKEFNEKAGQFVEIVKKSLREVDMAYSYDKDIFLALLPETNSKSGRMVKERILKKITAMDTRVKITTNLVSFPENGGSVTDLLKAIGLNQ